MRSPGQGVLAVVVAAVVVAGGVAAERRGPGSPAPASPGEAVSSTWLCPHGGGPGWTGTIALANPGTASVHVRLTSLSDRAPGAPTDLTVPAGGEVLQDVPATSRASATYVEAFGGWIGAGWQVRAADPEIGLGAEPCAPSAARTWYAPESTTQRGQKAFLVVMNPYAVDAVFSVALFSPDLPPLRDTEWSDIVLPAGRSVALRVDQKIVDEDAVGAQLDTKVGRVVVATLGVTDGGGVRSVLGTTAPTGAAFLPTAAGAGQSSLVMFVPGEQGLRFGATQLSKEPPQPAGALTEVQQPGQSAATYPIITAGPSSVDVLGQGPTLFVAALRAEGQSDDDAATGGAVAAAPTWVVMPTVAEEPSFPGLVVANPGNEDVTVTLRLLTPDGTAGGTTTFALAPSHAVGVPSAFLDTSPRASVVVSATGDVVALGGATSSGIRGLSLYALAIGIPVPDGAFPLP